MSSGLRKRSSATSSRAGSGPSTVAAAAIRSAIERVAPGRAAALDQPRAGQVLEEAHAPQGPDLVGEVGGQGGGAQVGLGLLPADEQPGARRDERRAGARVPPPWPRRPTRCRARPPGAPGRPASCPPGSRRPGSAAAALGSRPTASASGRRPLAGADVDQPGRARAACARRRPRPVRWWTSSSGSISRCRARASSSRSCAATWKIGVERLELDAGDRVQRLGTADAGPRPIGSPRCGGRGTRTAAPPARPGRRAARSRRPRCRRRSTPPAPPPARPPGPSPSRPRAAAQSHRRRPPASATGAWHVAVDDLDSAGAPSPSSTRHTRIDDAPKSTATTATGASATALRAPWRPSRRPAVADRRGPVADGPERGQRVEGRAVAAPGLGHERTHVGAEPPVQHLGRPGRIVRLLGLGQVGAVDAQCLGQGHLEGVGGLDQVLERVLEVVALVDHVGGRRASARRRPRAARR